MDTFDILLLVALITTVILLVGCVFIIKNGIERLLNPQKCDNWGVLVLVVIDKHIAALHPKERILTKKAIRLHLIEDVMGWVIVLIGAVVMYVTNWYVIDPILSFVLAGFILVNVVQNLVYILESFTKST